MNYKETIKNIFGEVATQKYPSKEDGVESVEFKDLTLGQAIQDTVLLEGTEVKTIPEEEHLLRYSIYEKVRMEESLTKEEITFVKMLISRRYLPLLAGQLLILINK